MANTKVKENQKQEKFLLSLPEVANALHLCYPKVLQMVAEKELPAFKIGRVWRISSDALDRWINANI
jgi:excisionase family DNA binding protein